jgi:hypothetical protein
VAGTGPPPPPEIQQTGRGALGPSVVPVASADSDSFSSLLPIVLVGALGLALILIAVALTPSWALPRTVGAVLYERRDSLIYAGIATAVSIGLGLLITLTFS